MFGEYGVYLDGKMIGSICDDQLYVKPTASGRLHADPVSEAPPYPGAKPHLLIEADRWDDAKWLGNLLRATAVELPIPKRGNRSEARKCPHGVVVLQACQPVIAVENRWLKDPIPAIRRPSSAP